MNPSVLLMVCLLSLYVAAMVMFWNSYSFALFADLKTV